MVIVERGYFLSHVQIGGQTRSFRVGFVSQEKDGSSSDDVEDKFKDDKFKDDPDVRGILSDIKGHFDQNDKGINLPPEPNEESVANGGEDKSAKSRGESKDNAKEEEGSAEGAKSMKELLEKIYGARTKAATQTSVGKDQISVGWCSNFIDSTCPGGYTEYRDADSRIILDVDEEREAMRRAIEVFNVDLYWALAIRIERCMFPLQEGREIDFDKGRKPTPGEKYSRQLKVKSS